MRAHAVVNVPCRDRAGVRHGVARRIHKGIARVAGKSRKKCSPRFPETYPPGAGPKLTMCWSSSTKVGPNSNKKMQSNGQRRPSLVEHGPNLANFGPNWPQIWPKIGPCWPTLRRSSAPKATQLLRNASGTAAVAAVAGGSLRECAAGNGQRQRLQRRRAAGDTSRTPWPPIGPRTVGE